MPKVAKIKAATVTIRLGENTKNTVAAYAAARDMTVGEFIRYTIRVYMDTTPLRKEDL